MGNFLKKLSDLLSLPLEMRPNFFSVGFHYPNDAVPHFRYQKMPKSESDTLTSRHTSCRRWAAPAAPPQLRQHASEVASRHSSPSAAPVRAPAYRSRTVDAVDVSAASVASAQPLPLGASSEG